MQNVRNSLNMEMIRRIFPENRGERESCLHKKRATESEILTSGGGEPKEKDAERRAISAVG